MIDVLREALRRLLVAFYPFVVPALRHIGWFAVFLLLAPAIGPHGYGLFIIALSGSAIVEGLWAATVSSALAGVTNIEKRHWSTALMTVIAGGAVLWTVLRLQAGPLSTLLGEPEARDLFQSLAILPLLGGLAAVPGAALRREGRQVVPVIANLAGFAAGSSVAVSLAWSGAGPWSLVAQIIVGRLVECLVLWGIPARRVGLEWSQQHFAELATAIGPRSFAADRRQLFAYATCLVVGLVLGPSAAGLFVLAMWPAAALTELGLARAGVRIPHAALRPAWQLAFPAFLVSTLLAVALPPLVDLRWWGAVFPAQILALGAVPAVLCGACVAPNKSGHMAWNLGTLAVSALVTRHGLTAIAGWNVVWTTFGAAVNLLPLRRRLGGEWRASLREAARPVTGATLAGLVLLVLAEPVSLLLAPVPALCLLTATAWLIDIVARGEPADARGADPSPGFIAPAPSEAGD